MEPTIFGYIRVSTKEQYEDRQLLALRHFPVRDDRIFMDKLSGKDFNRPQYQKLLQKLKREIFWWYSPSTVWDAAMRRF